MDQTSSPTEGFTDPDHSPVGTVEFVKLLHKYAQLMRNKAWYLSSLGGRLHTLAAVTDAATAAEEARIIELTKRYVYKHLLRRADLHADWCLRLLKGSSSLWKNGGMGELERQMMDLEMDDQK